MEHAVTPRHKSKIWTTESKFAYLLLLPALAFIIAFILYPISYVFLMAFFETDKLGRITTTYMLTEDAFEELRTEGVPEAVVEQLDSLKDRSYPREDRFLKIVERRLEDDFPTYQAQILKQAERRFAGLSNFALFFDEERPESKSFKQVTLRTVIWTVTSVVVKSIAGLIIALLLNIEFKGRRIYRTLVILPWASSVPISAMLWEWTFHSEFGLLNHTLKATGLWADPPLWLAHPFSAFMANLYVDIWIGIPFMAMVFLAGLQAIPKDIYESATVDGASAWVTFRAITLPMLKPVLLVATLLSSLWTFNDFNVIYILTEGGPIDKTDILITYIYKYSFKFLRFGPAAAMAVITFLILLAVSLVYARYYFRSEDV